jgi:transposase
MAIEDDLRAALAQKEGELAAVRGELAEVQSKLDYLMKKVFEPSSEKRPYVEPEGVQQTLFGTPVAEAPEKAETVTIPTHEREKAKPQGHGRSPVSRELPPEERIIPATPEQKVGPQGEPLVLLGYEISEKIDLSPETVRRLIIKREKWGYPDSRQTLATAAVEPCLIPKGKATDAFVLEIILNKFHLGLPLHRQLMDLNHRGAQLSSSFLSDLIKQAADVFEPIWVAMRRQIFQHRVVYADETPIRQLIPVAQGRSDAPDQRVRTGYYWAWIGGRQLYLHFGATRSQAEVRDVLGIPDEGEWDSDGLIAFLVTDGYAGYNPACAGVRRLIRRVACWAHVRRRFLECADRGDANAIELVAFITEIFRIERSIRKEIEKQELTGEAAYAYRLARRQRDIAPIVERIRIRIDELLPFYTAGRDMAKHITYTKNLWTALTVFLSDGEVPADNNTAERALRPVVVGRKNWLFVGSEDSGRWSAIFFSLIESCRMHKIDPRRYLAEVARRLVNKKDEDPEVDPATLTPASMAATIAAG